MTEKERWTVYPLLFLSLGIAMRSHVTSSLELREMTCHTLKSHDVQLTGGSITVCSPDGKPEVLIRATPGGGLVEVASTEGLPQVVLGGTQFGGFVEIVSAQGRKQLMLEVVPLGGAVEAFDARGEYVRMLAANASPQMRLKVVAPPATATEKPPGETTEPESDKPATPSEPPAEKPTGTPEESAGENPTGAGGEPVEKPAER